MSYLQYSFSKEIKAFSTSRTGGISEGMYASFNCTHYCGDNPMHVVRIKLSQHIGAPAAAVVKKGDFVTEGQMIAKPAEGLSVGIHASINGKVVDVTDAYVIIKKSKQEG